MDSLISEQPSGSIDGVNKVFKLKNYPHQIIQVVLNGQPVLEGTTYSVKGSVITFNSLPEHGGTVMVDYIPLKDWPFLRS